MEKLYVNAVKFKIPCICINGVMVSVSGAARSDQTKKRASCHTNYTDVIQIDIVKLKPRN